MITSNFTPAQLVTVDDFSPDILGATPGQAARRMIAHVEIDLASGRTLSLRLANARASISPRLKAALRARR